MKLGKADLEKKRIGLIKAQVLLRWQPHKLKLWWQMNMSVLNCRASRGLILAMLP